MRYRVTRSRLAPPDYFRAVDVNTHELGDDLGRHFLNREGALIHYSFACVHFLSDRTRAERNRRRSRIVAAPNCVLKLIVAAASIRSYTVCAVHAHVTSTQARPNDALSISLVNKSTSKRITDTINFNSRSDRDRTVTLHFALTARAVFAPSMLRICDLSGWPGRSRRSVPYRLEAWE